MGSGASTPASARLNWLSTLPCFRSLDQASLLTVSSKAHEITYKKGGVVIAEGGIGMVFGILVSGKVAVTASGPAGSPILLCHQSPGFFFGEAAIIGNTATTATITAIENCSVLALTSKELQELALENPEVRESLLTTVSLRMKQNLRKIPLFAQMENTLEQKKMFQMLGVFDLLSALFEIEAFEMKEVIFRAGDTGQKLYVVVEGCIKINALDISTDDEVTIAMLTKDHVFGEIALLEETTRTATAIAFEPSLVLAINREKFNSLTRVFPEFASIMVPLLTERTSNTLKTVPMFAELAKEQRDLVAQLLHFSSYLTGMKIFSEGQQNDGIHILIDGRVGVTKEKEEGGGEGEVELGEIEKGNLMGEISLLAAVPRTATLTALEPCRTLWMSEVNCRDLFTIVPELMEKMVEIAQVRRAHTVDVMGEKAVANIPRIDETKESKLHLYSLLRPAGVAGGGEEEEEEEEEEETSVTENTVAGKAPDAIRPATETTGGSVREIEVEVVATGSDEGEEDLATCHAKTNELKLEGQFLELQITDLLTCIRVLEHHKQVIGDPPATSANEEFCADGFKNRRVKWRRTYPRTKAENDGGDHAVLQAELTNDTTEFNQEIISGSNSPHAKKGEVTRKLINLGVTPDHIDRLTTEGNAGGGRKRGERRSYEDLKDLANVRRLVDDDAAAKSRLLFQDGDEAYSAVALAAIFSGDAHAEDKPDEKPGSKPRRMRMSAPSNLKKGGFVDAALRRMRMSAPSNLKKWSFVDAERAAHAKTKKEMQKKREARVETQQKAEAVK